MKVNLKNYLIILVTLSTLGISNTSNAQECIVISPDVIKIDDVQYAYFSNERVDKIRKDLELFTLYKQRVEILERQNKDLKAFVAFLQKQVDILITQPPSTSEHVDIYPIMGAYIIGNISASLLFGFWNKTSK